MTAERGMPPLVLAVSPRQRALGERIAAGVNGQPLIAPDDIAAPLRDAFGNGRPIIGICATGILLRALAPLLADKHAEPPVIAVSADGAHVVPLLGGHHGANDLARRIAGITGGVAAVTTASDTLFGVALDDPPPGWRLANPQDLKSFVAALMKGAEVFVESDAPDWLAESALPFTDAPDAAMRIVIAQEPVEPGPQRLVFYPRDLVIGVGMARDAAPEEMIDLVEATMERANLPLQRIAAIGTIAMKADEPALEALSQRLGAPVRLFSTDQLKRVEVPNPSAVVAVEVGTPSVAEAATLLLAGEGGRLLVEKRKNAMATVAVAQRPAPVADPDTLPGRARGALFVVGLGPGDASMRTTQAREALLSATDWVGYGLYLDLAADLAAGKRLHPFPLGAEEERVRHAIRLAGQGRRVALLCSGDAAIYAMASPVFELLSREEENWDDFARRITVEVVPGLTALQTASARAGALIGHDFCAISLSDLLTPWEVIERRLKAAAEGGFVTALYNPKSQRRTTQLERALAIFRAHRPQRTPVIIASNVGRPEEKVRVTTLAEMDTNQVDMLSIVLIGAPNSRFVTANGRPMAFTPRGYGA